METTGQVCSIPDQPWKPSETQKLLRDAAAECDGNGTIMLALERIIYALDVGRVNELAETLLTTWKPEGEPVAGEYAAVAAAVAAGQPVWLYLQPRVGDRLIRLEDELFAQPEPEAKAAANIVLMLRTASAVGHMQSIASAIANGANEGGVAFARILQERTRTEAGPEGLAS